VEPKIDGVPVHGNTDIGILRAVLRRDGFVDSEINARIPQMIEQMCSEVRSNSDQMQPELCPAILELLSGLQAQRKLLGTASGNVEPIGWLKLEKTGVRHLFSFGSFCFPLEYRADIVAHGVSLAREKLGGRAPVYVVGDTPADVAAARLIGVPIITVATGIYQFEELLSLRPDACFACGSDMLKTW